jgi:hypothetical protein
VSRRGRAREKVAIALLVLPPYATTGWLAIRAQTEPDRINRAVEAQQIQQQVALCIKWRTEAGGDVTPTSTQRVRDNVRAAASSYRLIGCEDVPGQGPLPPVDPEANRPAPTPSP